MNATAKLTDQLKNIENYKNTVMNDTTDLFYEVKKIIDYFNNKNSLKNTNNEFYIWDYNSFNYSKNGNKTFEIKNGFDNIINLEIETEYNEYDNLTVIKLESN